MKELSTSQKTIEITGVKNKLSLSEKKVFIDYERASREFFEISRKSSFEVQYPKIEQMPNFKKADKENRHIHKSNVFGIKRQLPRVSITYKET